MKRFAQILVIFVLTCITSLSFAQDRQFTGSVLWKVSGNGLTENSYIFGTNHVLSTSFLDKVNGLDSILNSCRQVIGEIDMNEMALNLNILKEATILPDGKTYSRLLQKEQYDILDQALRKELKIGFPQLETLSPVSILTMYTLSIYNSIAGQDENAVNMDTHFQEYARARGKKVIALETLEQQVQILFHSKPLQSQIEELLCVVTSTDIEDDMRRLDGYYQKGDLVGLEEMLNEESDCSSSSDEKDIMYKNRNDNWMIKIPDMIQDQPSFIAVGCLHLVGKDGLLNKLHLLGYRLEPVEIRR